MKSFLADMDEVVRDFHENGSSNEDLNDNQKFTKWYKERATQKNPERCFQKMNQDFKKENRTSISLDEGSGVCLKKETEYTQRILRACRKSQGWYLNETEFVVPGKLLPENKRILGDVLRESSCCKHRNIYFEDQRHSCLHQHRRE